MPIPKPQSDEDKNKFISRCISELKKEDPELTDEQISAICYNQWNEHGK